MHTYIHTYIHRFVVGAVESAHTSPVEFLADRCVYAFSHPREQRIDMDMKVSDLCMYAYVSICVYMCVLASKE